jgi:error-prone DNA polymerase
MAGAFASFGLKSPREALWQALAYQGQQGALLPITPKPDQMSFDGLSELELLQQDFAAFGVSTHGHPMKVLRHAKKLPGVHLASEVRLSQPGKKVRTAGMIIVRQKPPTAKGVCFCTMEDESGFLDLTFWPKTYDKYKHVFLNHAFVIVEGLLQRDRQSANVLVEKIWPIFDEASHLDETPLPIEPQQYF